MGGDEEGETFEEFEGGEAEDGGALWRRAWKVVEDVVGTVAGCGLEPLLTERGPGHVTQEAFEPGAVPALDADGRTHRR